jgi:tetratricopeptide (TPR) repeat protein
MTLWKIDTGQLDDAAGMALFAIGHGFETIAGFDRSLPNFVVEEIAEQLKKDVAIDLAKADTLAQLVEAKKGDGRHRVDILDEVRAKYLRQVGELHDKAENKERAIALYQKALEYNPKVGAKQLLDKLLKS